MKGFEVIYESIKNNHLFLMDKLANNHEFVLGLLILTTISSITQLLILFKIKGVHEEVKENKTTYKETLNVIRESNKEVKNAIVTLTAILKRMELREEMRQDLKQGR